MVSFPINANPASSLSHLRPPRGPPARARTAPDVNHHSLQYQWWARPILFLKVVTEITLDVRFPTSLTGDGTDAMYAIAQFADSLR